MMLTRQRNQVLIESLPEPKRVFSHFLRCTEIPRKSSHLDAISDYLQEFASQRGLYSNRDSAGNVVIRKDGAVGYESVPSVCMQAHMDMVCSSVTGDFDFLNSPIDCVYDAEKGLLKAEGTTLGADNGIGVATMLALLDEQMDIGPIECLFTYDEETTMSGAENIDPSLLVSKYMINLDSEEDNAICLGCAGGFETDLTIVDELSALSENQRTFSVEVFGLQGGHTGVDINKGRGNAIKMMARLLSNTNCRVINIAGGNAPNTIPRSCIVNLGVESGVETQFLNDLNHRFEELKAEYSSIEKDLSLNVSKNEEAPRLSFDEETSQKIFDILYLSPNGPVRMSPELENTVSTSISLSIITTTENEIRIHFMARSDNESASAEVRKSLESLARLTNVSISEVLMPYPGWTPNPDTKIMKSLLHAFDRLKLYPTPPNVYSIHAGLECGLILGKYPDMEVVSIGPLITNAHTPDEALHVETVEPYYQILVETLKAMKDF